MRSNLIIKFILLNKNNYRHSKNSDVEIKFSNTDDLRMQAYQIRYIAYLERGHIAKKKIPFWSDEFDHAPHTKVFLLFKRGVPAATIRLCFFDSSFMDDISEAIPSASQFGYTKKIIEKNFCLFQNFKVVEISKFASLIEDERFHAFICIYEFLRNAIFDLGADIILISVRLQHVKFYTRFGFKVIEVSKFYEKDNVTLSLLACSANKFYSIAENCGLNVVNISNFSNYDRRYTPYQPMVVNNRKSLISLARAKA